MGMSKLDNLSLQQFIIVTRFWKTDQIVANSISSNNKVL